MTQGKPSGVAAAQAMAKDIGRGDEFYEPVAWGVPDREDGHIWAVAISRKEAGKVTGNEFATVPLYAEYQVKELLRASRWIPVSERLPEDKEQCLVARGEDVGIAWWHSRPNEFIHEDIDNAWQPTHWMPLPDPPEVTP